MANSIFISDKCFLPDGFDTLSDLEKTIRFFKALGYEGKDDLYMRRFHDKGSSDYPAQNMGCKLEDYPSFRESAITFNNNGYGIFFVVNGDGHKDEKIKHVRAHFMEMDDYSFEEQARKIFSFPLEPSIIVKTRKSLHVYWIIKDGSIKRFQAIQKCLASYFDGDRVICNESRVMRVPYFFHNKQEPVMVEIVHFKPENVYSQDDLIEVLPEVYEGNVSSNKNIGKNERYELPDVIEEGHREHELFSYACSLQAKGFSDQEITNLVAEANKTNCIVPLDDDEIRRSVLSVLKNYKKGNSLKRFHKYSVKGVPYDTNDEAIRSYIISHYHLMVIGGKLYDYENGVYSQDENGIRTRERIKKLMYPEVVKNGRIKQALDLIMLDPGIQREADETNCYPKHWINFKNGMFDVKDLIMREHDPRYYSTNQIPHEFDPLYVIPESSTVNQFIMMKFPDEEDRKMFLQYCGYCMTTETNLQKFLILFGSGHTGKSTLIRLLSLAVGSKNTSHLSLQDIGEKFRTALICGKLLNSCGDLPSKRLEKLSTIKMITGEDPVTAEYKGGTPFSFRSYAKLIFSANSVPLSDEDDTGAYCRRLILIEVDDQADYIPDLEKKMAEDIDSFICLCVYALHDMLTQGFLESTNCKRHVNHFRSENDSVFGFLQEMTERDPDSKTLRQEIYEYYEQYCKDNDLPIKTRNDFYKSLFKKGFNTNVINNGYQYIRGLRLKDDFATFTGAQLEDQIPFN